MKSDFPLDIVTRFNKRINAQDVSGLAALMTDDHTFIDSAGHTVSGKEATIETWRGFFASFPDYRNVLERFAVRGDVVAVAGYSVCSHTELNRPAL